MLFRQSWKKKCSWGSVEEIISLERMVLWSQPSSIKHRRVCAMPVSLSLLSDESFALWRTGVCVDCEGSTVLFIDCASDTLTLLDYFSSL